MFSSLLTSLFHRLDIHTLNRYFLPVPPDRSNGEGRPGYRLIENMSRAEVGSDIHILLVDRMVSVTPLSLDLTSRVPIDVVHRQISEPSVSGQSTERLFELVSLPSPPSDRPRGRGGARVAAATLDAATSLKS